MRDDHPHLVADRLLKIVVEALGDVDVEPAGNNGGAVGIGYRIAHDHHLAYRPGGRADSCRLLNGATDCSQQTLDPGQVVGMLVTQDEFGGRFDFAGLIAVNPCEVSDHVQVPLS